MRADTSSTGFRLRTARGHLDAVVRMADDDRYCIDILHQLSAVQGALEGVRRDIIEAHLKGCVPEAAAEGRIDDIVSELMAALFGAVPGRKSTAHACESHSSHGDAGHGPTDHVAV
ncbi:MAG: transcriptional regulator [Actinobacteria bacterium HGW-Actinobacteria-4]|nr:MAG: transcriptional regulator [Actinobacteria bacterium HGW-Actinobacteria-4]